MLPKLGMTLGSKGEANAPPIEWGEFKEKFMERFLLKSIYQARAREFETLKQGLNMIVVKYDIRFTQLSRYAPHIILTKELKIEQFIEGLVFPLYNTVATQVEHFTTYAQDVDCARKIEFQRTT